MNHLNKIINNNKYNRLIYNNINIKRLFTTTNNDNNNNISKNFDSKKISDVLDEIRNLDLLGELKKEDAQNGFSYSKGYLKELKELMEREIMIETELQQKQMENDEDVYNKLMDDLKKRIEEREQDLKAQKRKSNLTFYLLSILLSIVIYQQYNLGTQRIDNYKKQFDDNWEKLRVFVNQRDQLREEKQSLINNLSNQILNDIQSKSIYSIDSDDIKYNVDSIVNEYCIENKSPSDILSKSNKNLSNSKI